MDPWGHRYAGRIEQKWLDSRLLRDNPLGDPVRRPVWVYLPPGYDADAQRRFPSVYVLLGLTGQVDMWQNRSPFRRSFPELADEIFAKKQTPPCILVYVDCWTRLGGSQYLDSPGTGQYMSYLCDEVVPFVDGQYRTAAQAAHRAVSGKSSGGYGAMILPMLRPDVFGALASHAGDALFETCYLPGFRHSVRALRDHYAGSFAKFWEDFRARPAFSKDWDATLLNDYCMAACYSADPDGSVRLPYDLFTGKLDQELWERWLDWDPVRRVARHVDALGGLAAIWVDAGNRDQYFLDLGAEAFVRELEKFGIRDVHYELFDATHNAIEYRYPLALRYLAERIG